MLTITKCLSAVSLMLLGLAIILSVTTTVNYTLFDYINHLLPYKAIWLTMTNTGDVLFLGCALFVLLRNRIRLLINALICAALIHLVVKWSKHFFAISRPEHTPEINNAIILGPAFDFTNYAMPSGHTASAFMAATFIVRAYNLTGWKLWVAFSYAVLVGLSRVAVGAHWPADVCAGAAIGIVFSLLCTHKKLDIKHSCVQYLSHILYLPFMYFAVLHAKHIHTLMSLATEGIIVITGFFALCVWGLHVKRNILNPPRLNM